MNKGDGTFENVYNRSGLQTSMQYVTQGAVSADVNKDDWRDLYVTTITAKKKKEKIPRAPNLLFINNGNGTFRDATKEYGLINICLSVPEQCLEMLMRWISRFVC